MNCSPWKKLRRLRSDPEKIADIHMRLADIEAHTAEARAASILSGLGFDGEAQRRPCSSFSGGLAHASSPGLYPVHQT